VQQGPFPGNPEALDPLGQEYEFGPEENQVIGLLATRMRRVGVMQIIAAGIQFVGYTTGFFAHKGAHRALMLGTQLPVALAFMVGGFLLLGAASGFRSIAATQGNDMGHLMKAFDRLAVMMTLLVVAFAIATAIWMVSFVLRVTGH
jgi:hypothetical protein